MERIGWSSTRSAGCESTGPELGIVSPLRLLRPRRPPLRQAFLSAGPPRRALKPVHGSLASPADLCLLTILASAQAGALSRRPF